MEDLGCAAVAPTTDTIDMLRWHAGLITEAPTSRGPSIDELLFEREPTQGEFDAALLDLLRTLQALSVELNGETPSEVIGTSEKELPTAAAYAISEITLRLRSRNRADAAWSVDLAWNAVLAGDIDDVIEHVQQERDAAR
jgi:hypothetical protein